MITISTPPLQAYPTTHPTMSLLLPADLIKSLMAISVESKALKFHIELSKMITNYDAGFQARFAEVKARKWELAGDISSNGQVEVKPVHPRQQPPSPRFTNTGRPLRKAAANAMDKLVAIVPATRPASGAALRSRNRWPNGVPLTMLEEELLGRGKLANAHKVVRPKAEDAIWQPKTKIPAKPSLKRKSEALRIADELEEEEESNKRERNL